MERLNNEQNNSQETAYSATQKRRWPILLLAILFLGVAAYSAWQVLDILWQREKQQSMFDSLLPDTSVSQSANAEGDPVPDLELQDRYDMMFSQYPDMEAVISIPDTILYYPVMQTPDWPNYYLRRNLEGEYSFYGVPYLNESCDMDASDNLIIYGHSMKNGEVFGTLLEYEREEYFLAHPTIQLFTRTGEAREYTVLGVFEIDLASGDPDLFNYNSFINAADEAAYNEYLRRVRQLAFYDTGVDAAWGDQLLTLSTCEYELTDGRFVVVAVRSN